MLGGWGRETAAAKVEGVEEQGGAGREAGSSLPQEWDFQHVVLWKNLAQAEHGIGQALAPNTHPITRDLRQGSRGRLSMAVLEREDGIIDAKNDVRGGLSTLFEHRENHMFSNPYRTRCGVWHLEACLDLN